MKGDEAPPTPKMEIFGESPLFADAASGEKTAPVTKAAAAASAFRRDIGDAADMVTAVVDGVGHLNELRAKDECDETAGEAAKAGAILDVLVEIVSEMAKVRDLVKIDAGKRAFGKLSLMRRQCTG